MSAAVAQIMGMPIVIDVRDERPHDEALERAFDWFSHVDATFSTYKEDSEIRRLERGELALDDADEDVRLVLDRCEALHDETGGYFDAHVSGRLDPSGLVKGWSVDRAADILRDAGLEHFAVSAGGDMRLVGSGWRVGIQHPRERESLAAVLELGDLAVATSGAYARGDHVVDPHTGAAPADVLSVTVVGPDLATADAYATAAFAMGARGPTWTARLRGYEAMTIMADEAVLTTGGFPDV
jgi:thiamine biosynthesis lipoprotein